MFSNDCQKKLTSNEDTELTQKSNIIKNLFSRKLIEKKTQPLNTKKKDLIKFYWGYN
jgi:hypothetical protein